MRRLFSPFVLFFLLLMWCFSYKSSIRCFAIKCESGHIPNPSNYRQSECFFLRDFTTFFALFLYFFLHPFYCHIQPFTIVYAISIYLYVLIENPSNQIHSELFLFKSNIYINLSLRPKHLKRLFHVQKW